MLAAEYTAVGHYFYFSTSFVRPADEIAGARDWLFTTRVAYHFAIAASKQARGRWSAPRPR
jgi:hypothetical protein